MLFTADVLKVKVLFTFRRYHTGALASQTQTNAHIIYFHYHLIKYFKNIF